MDIFSAMLKWFVNDEVAIQVQRNIWWPRRVMPTAAVRLKAAQKPRGGRSEAAPR